MTRLHFFSAIAGGALAAGCVGGSDGIWLFSFQPSGAPELWVDCTTNYTGSTCIEAGEDTGLAFEVISEVGSTEVLAQVVSIKGGEMSVVWDGGLMVGEADDEGLWTFVDSDYVSVVTSENGGGYRYNSVYANTVSNVLVLGPGDSAGQRTGSLKAHVVVESTWDEDDTWDESGPGPWNSNMPDWMIEDADGFRPDNDQLEIDCNASRCEISEYVELDTIWTVTAQKMRLASEDDLRFSGADQGFDLPVAD